MSNPGIGRLWGVAGSGDVTSLVLNNDGLIEVSRGPFTLGTVQSGSLTAHTGALANASLDIGAAVYSEEELEELIVYNTGTLRSSGQLVGAIYTRAESTTIINSGLIETTSPLTGFAIAAVSDSGETREFELDNSGTINGDILMINGAAMRYLALSKGWGTGGQTVDNRLGINSQFGQLDSTIRNSGTINGNFYYSNGQHELENDSTGTITGDIDVDQRNTEITGRTCTIGAANCFALGSVVGDKMIGNPAAEEASENSSSIITGISGSTVTYKLTIWGDKDFTFENAGIFNGNLTVRTVAAGTINGYAAEGSSVTLAPHITVSGIGSSINNAALGAGAINGTLKIWDGVNSTIASTTTLAPQIDHLVHSGEWFVVATSLFGTDLPTVENKPLVSWTAATNLSGQLVVGATVADASTITGISDNGASALNGLLQSSGLDPDVSALGAAFQNLSDEADIAEAADDLMPDVSGVNVDLAFEAVELMTENLGGDDDEEGHGKGVWIRGIGGWESGDDATLSGGVIAGIDAAFDDLGRAGVAFGYVHGATVGGDGDPVDVSTLAAIGYGTFKADGVVINASAGVAGHTFNSAHSLIIEDDYFWSRGTWNGVQTFANVEASYPVELENGIVIAPKAGLAAASLWQNGRTLDGNMGLSIDAQQDMSLKSSLGFEVEVPILTGDTEVSLSFEAAWVHQFAGARTASANFTDGPTFDIVTDQEDVDTAELGLGLSVSTDSGLTASFSGGIEVGPSDVGGHSLSATLGGTF